MASFFFYSLGSDPRQKSLLGIYRTLLYQILTASPGLMQFLFPDQWAKALSQPKIYSAFEISDDDIKQAFELLAKQHDHEAFAECCFGFFIDGLDEYQATTSIDRREMVHALMNVANSASGNFKICVSSRMENPFMDMFSEDTRLYLHELTRADMEEYVRGNLKHVGTQDERRLLASSITTRAEGVFLWVVLVVRNIRKQSDDGAKFSWLSAEIQSLPTELNELFQRILDTLGPRHRQLASHTISLLIFLGKIQEAKKMQIWLNLSDFYFLEDYESDPQFAESARFPGQDCEPVKESEVRARRQLRGVCRGLVEANIDRDLEFTHRSVRDFFRQRKVRAKMHDKSFDNLEALSQLKLASIKQYWWDTERRSENQDVEVLQEEERILSRHSTLAACIIERRRQRQLDGPPFAFLRSLDTVPQLSASAMISRALISNKTTFRIDLSRKRYLEDPIEELRDCFGSLECSYCEICHTSRVRHVLLDSWDKLPKECVDDSPYWRKRDGNSDTESSEVPWRGSEECVDDPWYYSTAVISPLLIELCSGRLEYPYWRISRLSEMPLESDALVMFAYSAIAIGIGRSRQRKSHVDENVLRAAGLRFLEHLFQQKIISPNFPTHLAFGGQFGIVRIAAGDQRLSLWQHFFCWWAAVAAASGDFEREEEGNPRFSGSLMVESSSERGTTSDDEHSETSSEPDSAEGYTSWDDDFRPRDPSEQNETGLILECFMRRGADLDMALKIEDGKEVIPSAADDTWLAYTMHMILNGGKPMEMDVVVNMGTRLLVDDYPYGAVKQRWEETGGDERPRQPLPSSALSVRDWINRSRLPNKQALLKLIDEKLGVAEADAVLASDENQDE